MIREIYSTGCIFILLVMITGGLYPLVMLGLGQALFPDQARGSLIRMHDAAGEHIVGSSLIGQSFTSNGYFHSRPSAAGDKGYDALASGASNQAMASAEFAAAVSARVNALKALGNITLVPADSVTASASGLDPHISVGAARVQMARVAEARGLNLVALEDLIMQHTEPRSFGFLGESHINVLLLNRALDEMKVTDKSPSPAVKE